MDKEQTTSAGSAPARKRAPSALQSLSRWLLGLWWVFVVALGGSIAQYLGNHGGPLVVTAIPQFMADVRQEPLGIQAGLAFTALAILIIAAMLTWLAWVDRNVRAQEEAEAVIADQKEALGQALDEHVAPQLTALSAQAGETHTVVVATGEKVDAVAEDVKEARDIAERIAERQKQPTPLVAGVTFTQVSELRRETFKLGDDEAANFPYVREPVATALGATTKALRDAAARDGGKRGVLILGEANAGKTRLALEALQDALPDWDLLRWSEARQTSDIPPAEIFASRSVVLFVDDAQSYAISTFTGPEGRAQQAIGAGATLRTLWESVQNAAARTLLIATCRTSEVQRLRGSIGWLFTELATVEIPSFHRSADDPAAAHIIELFEHSGAARGAKWDGTLGSLVLGLERKREEYDALADAHSPAVPALHAMKLLALVGVSEHTETRIRHVCAEILSEPRLLDVDAIWRKAVWELTSLQFVTEALSTNGQLALSIRKDAYFDDVVADYPDPLRLISFQQQRQGLRATFARLADDDALFDLGNSWFDAKNYEEAAKAFSDCTAINPSWGDAQYHKALALANLKREAEATAAWEETLAAYEQALRLDPEQAGVWAMKGGALASLKRNEEALVASEEALRLDPEQAALWNFKGAVLAELKRNEEALVAYEEALRLDPRQEFAWGNKGRTLYDLNRYEEAMQALEEALLLDPQQSDIWVTLGVALYDLERYEEALAAFEEALRLEPERADSWASKGSALANLEEYEEAVVAFEEALRLEPERADMWGGKGSALANLQQFSEALLAFEETLRLEPTRASVWALKGGVLAELHQYEAAIAAFDQSLALDPTIAIMWREKARMLIDGLQRYDDALPLAERAVELDPESVGGWTLKGNALQGLHEGDAAYVAYEHAIRLPAMGSFDLLWRGRALNGLKRHAEALEALDQSLTLDEQNADTWEEKAKALRALGREDEARQTEEQARALREQQA